MNRYLNWKSALVVIALLMVGASLYYTSELAKGLAVEERKNVAQLAEGIRTLTMSENDQEVTLAATLVTQNTTIPLILTDEKGEIIQTNNIDTAGVKDHQSYLKKTLREFQALHPAIESDFGSGKNFVYYGESHLLTRLRYFPYVQMTIILLFLLVVLVAISASYRSLQNGVWAGLSKETAHQLGTPLTALTGWVELLKESPASAPDAVPEMEKDLERLRLVADRFSKIGSDPQLNETDLMVQLRTMVDYMQVRSPRAVGISLSGPEEPVLFNVSGPLFDWVIENLLRNALDAMDGKGTIKILVRDSQRGVLIDVTDTGKGIPKHGMKRVFRPGYSTKQRGWGLGLSLSRRIIERYHHGSLFVKSSEVGKGTTFRLLLRR